MRLRLAFLIILIAALPVIALTQSASITPGSSGKLVTSGAAPTVSACGTSPSVVTGNNSAGRLTTGSGLLTDCTITFNPALTSTPICHCANQTGAQLMVTNTISATAFTCTGTGADITSDVINYICVQLP